MEVGNTFVHGKPVLVSLIVSLALFLAVSLYWHYQSYIRQQSLEKSRTGLQSNLADLQQQLQSAQENLSETETELQDLLAMDWQNRAIQQEKQARDWQQKHRAVEREQDRLLRDQAETRHQYENEVARLERGLEFQANLNNKLRGDLADKDRQLDDQEEGIGQYESRINALTGTITSLENKLQQQDKIIHHQAENKPADPVQPPVPNIPSYRQVRLESLKSALSGQDSNTRRIILADVIPTVPDGVNSDEFISLVAGMNSQDILTTIRTTEKYISRPFAGGFLELLSGLMDRNHVDEAVAILSMQQ